MEKYIGLACLILALVACDVISPKSPARKICEEIALSRLKHPGSFDLKSAVEATKEEGTRVVSLDFSGWNDFKVPLPHSIICYFEDNSLTAVKWNGRPVRQHELDEIRDKIHGPKNQGLKRPERAKRDPG